MDDEQVRQRRRRSRARSRRRRQEEKRRRFLILFLAVLAAAILAAAGALSGDRGGKREEAGLIHPEQLPGDDTGIGLGESRKNPGQESEADGRISESAGTAENLPAFMTLEEKIFQLFMVTPEALTGYDEVYMAGETTKDALWERPAGGPNQRKRRIFSDSFSGYEYNWRFLPFAAGIESGADFVMVGHISVPEVEEDGRPAVFSRIFVTDVLRKQMGFEGIIITDAMNMGAVTESYDSGEAAVAALLAGVDMILMPEDFEAAVQAVKAAVEEGTLTEKRIDESVMRIWKLKKEKKQAK